MLNDEDRGDEQVSGEGDPQSRPAPSTDDEPGKAEAKADGPAAAVLRVVEDDLTALEKDIVAQLRTVYDPEIPVDIYELGLIYDFRCDASGMAHVKMTLTSPMCPVAGTLPVEVQGKVQEVEGVNHCEVDLVFDPPWSPTEMTDAARLALNMGGMNF